MSKSERPIATIAALIANTFITVTKFLAAAASGSSAMLAEGIHSVVDTGNQALLLLGVKRSRRPSDARHPYGHGKEIYFWGLIVAIVLFGVGGGMSVYEGITHLLRPVPLEDPTWSYVVLGVAFVAEAASWRVAQRELVRRRPGGGVLGAFFASKDPGIFVVIAEDTAALVGIVIAFLGVLLSHELGMPELDGVASLLIGLLLSGVALLLAYQSRRLLVGESARPEIVRDIQRVAEEDPAVRQVARPMTMHLGPEEILLNLGVEFEPDLTVREIVAAIGRLEQQIQALYPEVKQIYIEAETLKA